MEESYSHEEAVKALVMATTALAKIEAHEKECSRRWGWVRFFLGIIAAGIVVPYLHELLKGVMG